MQALHSNDALRYCGKQLCRALIVEAYLYGLLFVLGLFIFVTDLIHPEWQAQHEANIEARMEAEEQAYKLKRVAAEKEQMLEAKHANNSQ